MHIGLIQAEHEREGLAQVRLIYNQASQIELNIELNVNSLHPQGMQLVGGVRCQCLQQLYTSQMVVKFFLQSHLLTGNAG